MTRTLRSVCLVTAGMEENNLRLQPWRYLHEVSHQLTHLGHRVTVISDGGNQHLTEEDLEGVHVQRLPSISNPWWRPNHRLIQAFQGSKPDVILWHVGLSSFLYQRLYAGGLATVIGIFTSPIYSWRDISRLGLRKLVKGYRLSLVHIINTLTPKSILCRFMRHSGLRSLVVQTETTAQGLRQNGLWRGPIEVIPPGVDEAWLQHPGETASELRDSLGYQPEEVVVVYFGSPAPLRGLPTLMRAFPHAKQECQALKLLILSRRRSDDLLPEARWLNDLSKEEDIGQDVKIVDGFLKQDELIQYVSAADLVALPFELVPSDAPLSLLEAQALGKPVVTTRVACLPELISNGSGYLTEPGDTFSLAQTLAKAVQKLGKDNGRSKLSSLEDLPTNPARSWQHVGMEWSTIIQRINN